MILTSKSVDHSGPAGPHAALLVVTATTNGQDGSTKKLIQKMECVESKTVRGQTGHPVVSVAAVEYGPAVEMDYQKKLSFVELKSALHQLINVIKP